MPTEVKRSSIPNSGNGRFAKTFIKKGTVLVKSPLINVYSDNIFDYDKAIVIRNVDELNHLISRYQQEFKSLSKDDILKDLRHFVANQIDGKFATLLCSNAHTNHSLLNENYIARIENNCWFGIATKDIKAGEEILQDYRTIRVKKDIDQYFKSYGLQTVNPFIDQIEKEVALKSKL